MNDFPVPIVRLTCSYKGAQNAAVYPVVVKAYSKRNNSSMLDAVWSIAVAGDSEAADDSEQENSEREKHLGMNSAASMTIHLGPGSIVMGELKVMLKDLTWESGYYSLNDDGSRNIISAEIGSASVATWNCCAVDQVRPGDTVYGDIVVTSGSVRESVGEVNYQTGEVTIDFAKLQKEWYFYEYQLVDANGNPINRYAFSRMRMGNAFAKIEYLSKQTTTGYPKTFYLADADLNSVEKPSQGHLYEGVNWFEAFVDMDGDGHYSAGEPYGFKRGVDIGWSGTELAIELTDTSPVFGRLRFDGTTWTCDRVAIHGSEADVIADTNNAENVFSGGVQDRLRVVRSQANDFGLGAESMAVIADKLVDISVRPYITEADVLGDGKFDVEEPGSLSSLLLNQNLEAVAYTLVFGDGELDDKFTAKRVAPYKIIRRFDPVRRKPVIVTEGKQTVFHGASPVFTWSDNGYGTYPAFKVQVRNTAGKVVYDSGVRLAPVRDADGNYTWTPDDLFVDDQCRAGTAAAVFSNTNQYTYRVQMCNAKYGETSSDWSADSPEFRMHVNVNADANDTGYSCVKVCVKYFGQKEVTQRVKDVAVFADKIRIEAFTSPDFTGVPVARGYYNGMKVALTNDDYSANAVLKGIPSGSYYIRAYVDNDGDFKRDSWESWGYVNSRDNTTSRNLYTPVPVTVGPKVAYAPSATLYIENVDLDHDWLPDAWEWVTSGGSFTAKGPGEFFDANVFGFANDFQKRFSRVSASGSQLASNLRALSSSSISSASMTALLLGVDTTGYASSAAALSAFVSPELVENGVSIESLRIENGKVIIKVVGETSAPASASVSSPMYTFANTDVRTLAVTCNVYVKETLASDEWTLAVSERVTVGGDAVEIQADKTGMASGFYKVEVVK
jgi:hypothetical protein